MTKFAVSFKTDEDAPIEGSYTELEADRFVVESGWLVFYDDLDRALCAYNSEGVTHVSRSDFWPTGP